MRVFLTILVWILVAEMLVVGLMCLHTYTSFLADIFIFGRCWKRASVIHTSTAILAQASCISCIPSCGGIASPLGCFVSTSKYFVKIRGLMGRRNLVRSGVQPSDLVDMAYVLDWNVWVCSCLSRGCRGLSQTLSFHVWLRVLSTESSRTKTCQTLETKPHGCLDM